MKGNVTVPKSLTVTVTESRPLTIADDYTLTLDTGARLINDNNSITVNENGKLKNNGIVELTADGYHWDAAGKTLTLHGISITGSLKLPDVSPMRVVTEDESYVDRIEFPFSYSSNVLFSGTAPLTVQQKISDYQSTELTIEAGAALRALSGIEVGASGGVDSSITVNGMLTSNGGSDNYALYAGKVTIGSTGALTVSGDKGVRVNGVRPLGGNIVFTDAFKLENGGNVSLDLLNRLAHFYRESPLYFMKPAVQDNHLVRKGNGDPIQLKSDEGIEMVSLIAMKEHMMYPVFCTVKPGCGNMTPHTHNGEEMLYIFSGVVEVRLNDDPPYILHPGDTFYYRGSDLHSWQNVSTKPAKFLWVHSALSK